MGLRHPVGSSVVVFNDVNDSLQKSLIKEQYSAKETYTLIDRTDRSHPIGFCSSF